MCNLYSMTKNQDAIRRLFNFDVDSTGNLPSMPGIFPDYPAPIVRNADGTTELTLARWGMPSSQFAQMQATKKRAAKLEEKGKPVDFKELLRMEPDGGTTNIRNLDSKHWKRWLGVESRCLVPFTSFSEFNKAEGGDIWFAFDETRPLAFFAGIWTNWTSVRKVKEGETTNDLFAFLTTEPNAEVGAIHPKAMPVILTNPEELQSWMKAPRRRGDEASASPPGRRAQDRRPRHQERRSYCSMTKYVDDRRPYATAEAAAARLLEIAKTLRIDEGRMSIGEWNGTFLRGGTANVEEYTAGRDKLIADGIIQIHECGGFIMWKSTDHRTLSEA